MTLRGSAGLWSGLATAGPSCESAGELEEEGGRACCQLQSWAGHDNCRDSDCDCDCDTPLSRYQQGES